MTTCGLRRAVVSPRRDGDAPGVPAAVLDAPCGPLAPVTRGGAARLMPTGGRPAPGRRVARSLAVLVTVSAALVVGPAAAARAHGPAPDGTDFRSTVTGLVDADGDPVDVPGVTWRVLGSDALLQVRTTGDAVVVVSGYDDEPYLRIGPDGVFENRNSPATWLNADRYANATVPADVDPDDPPTWQRIGDGRQWRWHDHRIHWMAPTVPPPVRDRPGVEQQILQWRVPFTLDGRELAADGELVYVPPPPVWPWLAGAAVMLTLPVALAAVRGRGARQTVVALVVAVAAGGVTVTVGDVLATPASLAADAWTVVQTAVPAVAAAALAWSAWRAAARSRDGPRPESTLVVASVIVAFTSGVGRLSQLTSSQVTTALPEAVVRAVVAASLVLVVPCLVALAAAWLPGRARAATPP